MHRLRVLRSIWTNRPVRDAKAAKRLDTSRRAEASVLSQLPKCGLVLSYQHSKIKENEEWKDLLSVGQGFYHVAYVFPKFPMFTPRSKSIFLVYTCPIDVFLKPYPEAHYLRRADHGACIHVRLYIHKSGFNPHLSRKNSQASVARPPERYLGLV